MSSSFRALSRFSSSQITSQYVSRPPPPSSVSQFSRVGRNLAKSGRVLIDLANVVDDMHISETSLVLGNDGAGSSDRDKQSGNWPRASTNWPKLERTSKEPGPNGIDGEGHHIRNSFALALTAIEKTMIEEALPENEAVPEASSTKILIACLVSLVVS